MAGELQIDYLTGKTVYAQLRSAVGTIWNGAALEVYATANIATYSIVAVEQGTASGYYTATMPAVAAGVYNVVAKDRAGGAPAESDRTVATGQIEWDGAAVVSLTSRALPGSAMTLAVGAIAEASFTVPADGTGQATGILSMILWLYKRFFGKVIYDSSANTLKTYQAGGVTVRTTQAATVAGSQQETDAAT